MDSDEEVMLGMIIGVIGLRRKQRRRMWMRPYLARRHNAASIMNELKIEDRFGFKNFLRMSEQDFNVLLQKVLPIISKQDTQLRAAIPAHLRLGITLRFLASGDSYTSIMYLVKVSKQQISKIVPEVCEAITTALQEEYLKVEFSEQYWIEKEEGFHEKWNFPHCVGAMDGKHVVLQAPTNSGSLFRNYKHSFSIVLLAVVDAHYKFTFVDIGCQGRISDAGVFRNTTLYESLENKKINLPQERPLPGREYSMPYVIVCDEAFALTKNIMKPYSGTHDKGSKERIFNYRLSRARNVVENTFGILASVFRVYRKPMSLKVDTAISVVMATTVLHNFLRRSATSRATYTPPGSFDLEDTDTGITIPGLWRKEGAVEGLRPLRGIPRRNSASAKDVREEFAEFFTGVGRVPWQN